MDYKTSVIFYINILHFAETNLKNQFLESFSCLIEHNLCGDQSVELYLKHGLASVQYNDFKAAEFVKLLQWRLNTF